MDFAQDSLSEYEGMEKTIATRNLLTVTKLSCNVMVGY